MLSERVIDERTRPLPESKFFRLNGAKTDRDWNRHTKPEELRAKWCEMMNASMAREGIAERVDPRSWADQGGMISLHWSIRSVSGEWSRRSSSALCFQGIYWFWDVLGCLWKE